MHAHLNVLIFRLANVFATESWKQNKPIITVM